MEDARREYGDLIDRERPVSRRHAPMPRLNRAAQFAPFAALTGYDGLIREAERFTDEERDLDEAAKEELNDRLVFLLKELPSPPAVFTYFVADGKKEGGAYHTETARVIKYDALSRLLTLEGGKTVSLSDLLRIEGGPFEEAFEE